MTVTPGRTARTVRTVRTHPAFLLAAALLATGLLSGCSDPDTGDDPTPHPDVSANATTGDGIAIVEQDEADLVLWVSNQSFDDEHLTITVEVDGVTVVDDDFHVEGQHTYVAFPLALPAGEHTVTARADNGATLTETFRRPEGQKRYALISHWGAGDEASLDWRIQREPMAFA